MLLCEHVVSAGLVIICTSLSHNHITVYTEAAPLMLRGLLFMKHMNLKLHGKIITHSQRTSTSLFEKLGIVPQCGIKQIYNCIHSGIAMQKWQPLSQCMTLVVLKASHSSKVACNPYLLVLHPNKTCQFLAFPCACCFSKETGVPRLLMPHTNKTCLCFAELAVWPSLGPATRRKIHTPPVC